MRESRKASADARWGNKCVVDDVTTTHEPKERTRAAVAKEYGVPVGVPPVKHLKLNMGAPVKPPGLTTGLTFHGVCPLP